MFKCCCCLNAAAIIVQVLLLKEINKEQYSKDDNMEGHLTNIICRDHTSNSADVMKRAVRQGALDGRCIVCKKM